VTRIGAAAAIALLGMATFLPKLAPAEQTGGGGVTVSLDGRISPKRLPRDRLVPVSITLQGSIRADDGGAPPRLGLLEFAIGAGGGLDTRGLPRCPRARLRNATARQALERCRGTLVGRGTVSTMAPLSSTDPLLVRAGLLAFNGSSHGRPAVWLHAYSASPPISFVLPFYLRRVDQGAYGVLMRAPVGRTLGRWPRLRSFQISLGRLYRARGMAHSYLRANCPLPPRLHVGYFQLRASYRFVPKPSHTTTILRSCRVRG
jgi:hypothetical protein